MFNNIFMKKLPANIKSYINHDFLHSKSFDIDLYKSIDLIINKKLKGNKTEHVTDLIDSAILIYKIDNSFLRVFISEPWEVTIYADDKEIINNIENQVNKRTSKSNGNDVNNINDVDKNDSPKF